jgi:hypothetical protein
LSELAAVTTVVLLVVDPEADADVVVDAALSDEVVLLLWPQPINPTASVAATAKAAIADIGFICFSSPVDAHIIGVDA